MKKIIALAVGLLLAILAPFAAEAHAQAYKMLAPSADQQMFYGTASLANGSVTVEVLSGGTVTAAVATMAAGLPSGTDTPRLVVTKSGGSITIQAYDATGTNTSLSRPVNYVGGGSQ